jgi:hypothetical protein
MHCIKKLQLPNLLKQFSTGDAKGDLSPKTQSVSKLYTALARDYW